MRTETKELLWRHIELLTYLFGEYSEEKNSECAGVVASLLHFAFAYINEEESGRTKPRNIRKPKEVFKVFTMRRLRHSQYLALRAVFNLDGEKYKCLADIIRAMHPEEDLPDHGLFRYKAYGLVRGALKEGLRKLERVWNGEINICYLPPRDQELYADLLMRHPNSSFEDLRAIARLVTEGKQAKIDTPRRPPSVRALTTIHSRIGRLRFCAKCNLLLNEKNPGPLCSSCQRETAEAETFRKKGGKPTHHGAAKIK